jgi:hypothetical protein
LIEIDPISGRAGLSLEERRSLLKPRDGASELAESIILT